MKPRAHFPVRNPGESLEAYQLRVEEHSSKFTTAKILATSWAPEKVVLAAEQLQCSPAALVHALGVIGMSDTDPKKKYQAKGIKLTSLVPILSVHFKDPKTGKCDHKAARDFVERLRDQTSLVKYDRDLERIYPGFVITDDMVDAVNTHRYPAPMVCPPKKRTHNMDGAYLTGGSVTNNPFKETQDGDYLDPTFAGGAPALLGRTRHNADINLSFLDKMGSIPLSLELRVFDWIPEVREKMEERKLIESKSGHKYREPFKIHHVRVMTWLDYKRHKQDIRDHLVENGNRFYIPWGYDARGRFYTYGYYINPQGTSYQKAVLCLANKELISDEAPDELQEYAEALSKALGF